MTDILTGLCLLGYCLAIRRFIRWPIEAAPFFIIALTIILFYGLAYFNILQSGSLFFILLGGLCLIAAPYYLWNQRDQFWQTYFTPGFVIFIFYIILFGITVQYRIITDWDSLVRWLPHAKLIYLNHGFLTTTNTTGDKDYPPGGGLFYYLFLRLSDFSESRLFLAQLLLLLAPLLILLRKYRWKNWSDAFIIFSIILLIFTLLFGLRLSTINKIMMDDPAGLFFGGILASYFIMQKDRALWFYLILPTMALVLFKPMLFPFVALVGGIILSDQLYLVLTKQQKLSHAVLFIGIWLLPAVPLISWQYYVSHFLGSSVHWNFGDLITAIKTNHMTIPRNEFHPLFHRYLVDLTGPLLFMIIMLGVAIWIYRQLHEQALKHRLLITHIELALCYIAYICFLLLIYFYYMPGIMVEQMNSFKRFIDIYQMGWLIVLIAHLFYFSDQPSRWLAAITNKIKYIIVFGFIALLISYTIFCVYTTRVRFDAHKNTEYLRYAVKHHVTDPMQPMLNANSKIGIIWSGWMLMPAIIGNEFLPKSIYFFTEDLGTAQSFESQIGQLNYLLVGGKINSFWQRYSAYLPNKSQNIPYVILPLCTDDNFEKANNKSCTIHQVPLFLYKVITTDGKLHLVNVTKGSS